MKLGIILAFLMTMLMMGSVLGSAATIRKEESVLQLLDDEEFDFVVQIDFKAIIDDPEWANYDANIKFNKVSNRLNVDKEFKVKVIANYWFDMDDDDGEIEINRKVEIVECAISVEMIYSEKILFDPINNDGEQCIMWDESYEGHIMQWHNTEEPAGTVYAQQIFEETATVPDWADGNGNNKTNALFQVWCKIEFKDYIWDDDEGWVQNPDLKEFPWRKESDGKRLKFGPRSRPLLINNPLLLRLLDEIPSLKIFL